MVVDSMVSGGCVVSGATVRRLLLFSDVRVETHSRVEDSVLLPQVRVGARAVIRRAVVDSGCTIPDGATVGVDASADRARFHVTQRGITLVTPEMLGQRTFGVR